jgi:hypothetical protein
MWLTKLAGKTVSTGQQHGSKALLPLLFLLLVGADCRVLGAGLGGNSDTQGVAGE